MLLLFVILALIVAAIVAVFVIALVAHKAGLVDDGAFARYSSISTIVGVPLGVIAIIIAVAGLVRDGGGGGGSGGSPSPSQSVVVVNSPPSNRSAPATPVHLQTPRPLLTPTPDQRPQVQQQEVTSETRPRTTPHDSPPSTPATQTRYERGDIGARKENGYYEISLENARTAQTCTSGYARVSNQEKLITVTFSIRAAHLDVPSIPTSRDVDAYYIEDGEGRRYQMSCGDGRYFNVSLNSFEGKPKPKTLTVGFVIPIAAQSLRFRFNPPAGDAIVLMLPSPL